MKFAIAALALVGAASAISQLDFPEEYPCVDQNAAAGVLFIRDESRASVETPVNFRSWNLINDEGLQSAEFPCERLAAANMCGEHANEAMDYFLVAHLCPRSCGICPRGNNKAMFAGDGSFQAGTDQNEFMGMIYGGRDCNDAAKHGWKNLSCEKDAVVRSLCGATCPNNCQRMGWAYEDFTKPLKHIAGFQESAGESCAGVPYNHCQAMTFGEAEDRCKSWGAHLCSLSEISSGVTRSVWTHNHFNMDGDCHKHMRTWVNPVNGEDDDEVCAGVHSAGGRTHGSIIASDPDKFECQDVGQKNSPMCCFGEITEERFDHPIGTGPYADRYGSICPCCDTMICTFSSSGVGNCDTSCTCEDLVLALIEDDEGDCCFTSMDSEVELALVCPIACAKYDQIPAGGC